MLYSSKVFNLIENFECIKSNICSLVAGGLAGRDEHTSGQYVMP